MDVWYAVFGEEGLELIEPLWLQLRQMHRARSTYFRDALGSKSFHQRKDELLEISSKGLLRVELAKDEHGTIVAYCVASIDDELTGEVDSLFVTAAHRGRGIGTRLIEGAMRWMDGLGVRRRVLTAIVGNESIHEFYARFGFRPKNVLLERIPNAGAEGASDKPI
ncbi:MAG: GNAT family N-acetyltransferase [Methanomassiliicoccales archaeon]|nr:GNAT family N-acetyltransferase [Methanomassiliicoccales archaeon]